MNKRDRVSRVDLIRAYHNWAKVADYTNSYDFEDFLMYPTLVNHLSYVHDYWDVPIQTKQRIDMLLGPHYRTIIKAYFARKETSVEEC